MSNIAGLQPGPFPPTARLVKRFARILTGIVCLLLLLLWPTFSMLLTISAQFALISGMAGMLIALFLWNNLLLGLIIRLLFAAKTTWQQLQTARLLDRSIYIEKSSVIDCWEDYSDPESSLYFVTLQFEDLFNIEFQIPAKLYQKIEIGDIVPIHCLKDNPNIFRPDWQNKQPASSETITYAPPQAQNPTEKQRYRDFSNYLADTKTYPVDDDKSGSPG